MSGATSNPTIFAAAICGSERYDAQLAAASSSDPAELFLDLALEDVRSAAALMPHGHVSFEVTPDAAYDTAATVVQAVDLWRRLDAPNAMIKVPATEPGVAAVEELTARGVSVNVTLLFSVDRYEQIVEGYLRGLERRARVGEPLEGIASVASFFVSRVDANADARLPAGSPLRGRVGIANARLAYELFRQRFTGPRWERLADLGAAVQRPLWASTAPKDPAYRDVVYLEQLALPDSILTVPEPTLRAFADHGDPGRTEPLDPRADEQTVAAVDLAAISRDLEREGVEAFERSYEELRACIAERLEAVRRGAAVSAAA